MIIDRDKILPKGDEKLFYKAEWISSDKMDNETKVLTLPILHEAFDRVVETHRPIQPTAFLSLCTATRPYYSSHKWKKFKESFGNKVDMIVVSNGGMVPEPFWESWPYLNYEAGPHENDVLYKKVMYDRMMKFFHTHSYEYVIANFNPKQRNYEPAKDSLTELKEYGVIKDFTIIPEQELYNKAKDDGFHGSINSAGDMFPDLHKFILDSLIQQVETFGYDESKIKTIYDYE
jgi:predicted RNA-binding protein|tara:strand:+ start:923 stop:1618 length:696 start_codon:yes stop_codon:yes gene_type:complete